uniref:C2H2-type domain-containing protein n=1 Tax=Glossina morsitans morsitans TaxID=37546 RepID=A0A1B0GEV9_GLOMM
MFENLGKQDFEKGLRTVSLDKLDILTRQENDCPCPVEEVNDIVDDLAPLPPSSADDEKAQQSEQKKSKKLLTCRCKICNEQFNALSNLRRHISMFHHRARRFGCTLCEYRAFKRHDIVNHLGFVHKMTGERDVMALEYVSVHKVNYSKDDVEGDILVVSEDIDIDKDDKLETVIKRKKLRALSERRRVQLTMFHYRARRFGCTLCEYRAFRRYDIVNHLGFVHKMTGERDVMALEYVSVHEVNYSKDDVEGDILVVSEDIDIDKDDKLETVIKRKKRKKLMPLAEVAHPESSENGRLKGAKQKLRKGFRQQMEGNAKCTRKRPIRNRIKPENKDFVYDLSNLQEDTRENQRSNLKRRNTYLGEHRSSLTLELTPPIKITPYRLRMEPLLPTNKSSIKGIVGRLYRSVVNNGLAAASTLPEIPTERPQMRPRLTSICRNDSCLLLKLPNDYNQTSLKSSPSSSSSTFELPLETLKESSALNLDHTQTDQQLQIETTPNGKVIAETSSPPSTPKKRINLTQRLIDSRSKRHDNVLRAALEQ